MIPGSTRGEPRFTSIYVLHGNRLVLGSAIDATPKSATDRLSSFAANADFPTGVLAGKAVLGASDILILAETQHDVQGSSLRRQKMDRA